MILKYFKHQNIPEVCFVDMNKNLQYPEKSLERSLLLIQIISDTIICLPCIISIKSNTFSDMNVCFQLI